jgi:hypothetical protein
MNPTSGAKTYSLAWIKWIAFFVVIAAVGVLGAFRLLARPGSQGSVLGEAMYKEKGIWANKYKAGDGWSHNVNVGQRGLGKNITPKDIQAIAGLKDIGYLTINGPGGAWVADVLKEVAALRSARVVQLSNGALDDTAMDALNKFVNLPTLAFFQESGAGRALARLQNQSVAHLTLMSCDLDDKALAGLNPELRLESISLLGNPKIRGEGLDKVAAIKTLKRLRLDGVGVESAGLVHFKDHPNLESLTLTDTRLAGKDLQAIGSNKALKTLSLDGKGFSDAALEAIGGLENLDALTLMNTSVTEQGLAHLKGAKNLKDVTLGLKLSETGIRNLASLPNLEKIKASIPTLTTDMVREVAALKSLKVLDPWQPTPNIDAELLRELAATNPNLKVIQEKLRK